MVLTKFSHLQYPTIYTFQPDTYFLNPKNYTQRTVIIDKARVK